MAEEIIQQEQEAAAEQTLEQLISGNPAYQEQYAAMLAQSRQSWQQEAAAEQSEAEKLSRMSAAQRERYQFDKDKAAFAQEKAAFERQQLTLQMGAELQKRGFSSELSGWITGKDAAESMQNLNAFEEMFKAEIQKGMSGVMRGRSTPTEPKAKVPQDAFLKGFDM